MENSNIQSHKRQRTEIYTRSAKLKDLDVLDCPVCYELLTIPIFQCENGHLVCSKCLPKVKNKCPGPACILRIGKKRCFSMEKVVETVVIHCQNSGFGCPKTFNHGNQTNLSNHEKECKYLKCVCPKVDCNFTGSSESVFYHFYCMHFEDSNNVFFKLGNQIHIIGKNLVLLEKSAKMLVVVQCFREEHGVYVTIRHLLSSLSDVEKFKYYLSYRVDGDILYYGSPEMKRFHEVTSQRPEESFLFVPNSFLRGDILDIIVQIKLNKK